MAKQTRNKESKAMKVYICLMFGYNINDNANMQSKVLGVFSTAEKARICIKRWSAHLRDKNKDTVQYSDIGSGIYGTVDGVMYSYYFVEWGLDTDLLDGVGGEREEKE